MRIYEGHCTELSNARTWGLVQACLLPPLTRAVIRLVFMFVKRNTHRCRTIADTECVGRLAGMFSIEQAD